MPNGISLLPDEYKKKAEKEEQARSKGALPTFSMHKPEKVDYQNNRNEIKDNSVRSDIKFGDLSIKKNEATQKVVADPVQSAPIIKKEVKPISNKPKLTQPEIVKPIVDKPKLTQPEIVKPEIKKIPNQKVFSAKPKITETKNLEMRIPNPEKITNQSGNSIVKEADDRYDDVRKSYSIFDLFKKDNFAKKLRREPVELNLILEDYTAVVKKQFWLRIRALSIIVLLFVLMFSVVFIGLKVYKVNLINHYNANNQTISNLTMQIDSFNTDQVETQKFKERAEVLKNLLNEHKYWTNIFSFLEQNTVEGVYYQNFISNENGQITLKAEADSFPTMAKQLIMFEAANELESVDISNGVLNGGKTVEGSVQSKEYVEFMIDLVFKNDFLIN